MSVWAPPAGTVIRSICVNHRERIIREGVVGPAGECSHGYCPECIDAMRRELVLEQRLEDARRGK